MQRLDLGLRAPNLRVSNQADLAASVVKAMAGSHENLAAAQLTSQQSGQGVYAQIWRSLCLELAATLSAARYDVQMLKPGHASYKIPVIGDVLLFPWRPAGGHEPTEVCFSTSATRAALWSHPMLPDIIDLGSNTTENAALDDDTAAGSAVGLAEVDAVASVAVEIFEAARRQHLRVVVIAMTSDSQRLRSIEWGEATVDSGGFLRWVSHEVLSNAASAATPADTNPRAFSAGTPPPSGVRLRQDMTGSKSDG